LRWYIIAEYCVELFATTINAVTRTAHISYKHIRFHGAIDLGVVFPRHFPTMCILLLALAELVIQLPSARKRGR
jgi:hypothetical protein